MRDFAAVLVSVASVITALSLRFGTLNRGVSINGGMNKSVRLMIQTGEQWSGQQGVILQLK